MRLDHEVEPAKPAGTCRIAMIGDSFFMGYELNYPDTIGARLEKRLRDDGFNVEVLNFAVSGFGTSEALVTYDRYARTFAPDLVLQEWDKTDFNDNVRSDLYDVQDGALKQVNDSYLPGVDLQDRLNRYHAYRFVSENLQIYGFAREIIGSYLKDITVGIPAALDRMRGFFLPAEAPTTATVQDASKRPFTDPRRDVTDDAMVLSSALLQEFNRRTAADGVGFVLLDIPFQLSDASVLSSLKAMPEQTFAGIDVVSAVDEFNRAMGKGDKLYYKKGAGHFTPEGAALLVEKAAPVLERHPSLAKCRIQ